MRICSNCGTTNATNSGTKECKNCGSPLFMTSSVKKTKKVIKRSKKKPSKRTKKSTSSKRSTKKTTIRITKSTKAVSSASDHVERFKFLTKVQNIDQKRLKPKIAQGKNLQPIPMKNFTTSKIAKKNPALVSIAPSSGQSIIVPHPVKRQKLPQKKKQETKNDKQNQVHLQKVSPPNKQDKEMKQQKSSHQLSKSTLAKSGSLERAMTEAVVSLQNDIGFNYEKQKSSKDNKSLSGDKIASRKIEVPDSLNEILINLAELDLNIEASALVNSNGDILASAYSRYISESLISTIAQTLGRISQDMISSLDSGDLKFISIQGTRGILFMAPIMKNVFLLLLTSPESKSGVINIAKLLVKKQITLYFAKKNLKKSPL